MIYAYWRTGSNLLVKTLQQFDNYYDLNEYYSFVHDSWYDLNNNAKAPLRLLDIYLQMLTRDTNKAILKCMLKQKRFISPEIDKLYDNKILLHRYNLEKSILSKFIAEARQSWVRTSLLSQPYYDDAIDVPYFEDYINVCLRDYEKFIDENENIRTQWYFSYEEDLVPFVMRYPVDFYLTNNVNIQNIDTIRSLFLGNSIKRRMNDINEWFKSKKSLNNGRTLDDLREMIIANKEKNE